LYSHKIEYLLLTIDYYTQPQLPILINVNPLEESVIELKGNNQYSIDNSKY